MSGFAGSIRVLHVDDEPDFAEMAATFVERQGDRVSVETAPSASRGLERLVKADFDCIVSDYDMPGQNGIEFLEAVRGGHPDLPFILYTGKGSEEVASDAISAGVTDYLQKGTGTSQYAVLANRIENVVEQHRMREEAADTERRLSLFFEQSPLGVIRWDDEFNFARLNETARDILGYDEGELVGEPWETVVPEEDHEEIGEVVVADLLADEGGYHSINENVRKDGTQIVCEWHNWVVTDDDDEVVVVFSQFQDVTEREARERQVAALERYNREIVENAPMGIFRLDERMRIIDENRRAEEIVGVPEGEDESAAIGRDPRELPSVRDTDAVEALDRLEAGETVSFDTEFESIFGKESHLIGKGVPLYAEGAFDGAIIIVVDVSERERRSAELERTRELLDHTEQIADVAGWEIDPDTREVFWTDHLFDLLGVDYDEEPPLDEALDVYLEEDRPRVEQAVEEALASGEPFEVEARYRRPDGEVRWFRIQGVPTFEDGAVATLRGAVQDVTGRKERDAGR